MSEEILRISLSAAVPAWILEMRTFTPENLRRIASESGQVVAEKGDVLQFRTKHRTAEAFNALARGLAAMTLLQGEVRWLGLHFRA